MTILAKIYDDPTFFGSGPGFVNRTKSDPGFVNPVRSSPGFVSPIRSDPGPDFVNTHRTIVAYTLRFISSSALILTLVNIVFLRLRTVSHGFKRIRLDLSHNPSSFDSTLHKLLRMCAVTSQHGGGHSFYGSNRKKRCSKCRTFNFENDHGFWALFVTFESQNLLFHAFLPQI